LTRGGDLPGRRTARVNVAGDVSPETVEQAGVVARATYRHQTGIMADIELSPPPLLDEVAGLHPQARRALATTLRRVSETFTEVPDGTTPHTCWGCLPTCSAQPDPQARMRKEHSARGWAKSATLTHHKPLLIHCLAASVCPAGKCLISAETKCDARRSATSPRWESVTTAIFFMRL
jgi:hypothetical protein